MAEVLDAGVVKADGVRGPAGPKRLAPGPERAGERVEHALGDPTHVSALQAGVVRNAHAGQDGDLLAAQSGNAPGAVGGQPRLLRRDPGASRGEELADLAPGVHNRRVEPPGR